MSHFCVLVIGDDHEKLLAPYDEEIKVEPYKDHEPPVPVGWEITERNGAEFQRLQDGGMSHGEAWKTVWGERNDDPRVPFPNSVAYREGGIDPHDLRAVMDFYNAKHPDSERYELDEQGLYTWSTYSRKSRWDWYSVGGRWAGSLIVKPGTELVPGARGTTGIFADGTEYPTDLHVDRALWGTIDWERMGAEQVDRARERYRRRQDEPDALRRLSGITDGLSEDDYVRSQVGFTTFAVVTPDGEWHERGKMGWFAMVADEMPYEDWVKEWRRLADAHCEADTVVTMADLHI